MKKNYSFLAMVEAIQTDRQHEILLLFNMNIEYTAVAWITCSYNTNCRQQVT